MKHEDSEILNNLTNNIIALLEQEQQQQDPNTRTVLHDLAMRFITECHKYLDKLESPLQFYRFHGDGKVEWKDYDNETTAPDRPNVELRDRENEKRVIHELKEHLNHLKSKKEELISQESLNKYSEQERNKQFLERTSSLSDIKRAMLKLARSEQEDHTQNQTEPLFYDDLYDID